jgi:hypothetical protein
LLKLLQETGASGNCINGEKVMGLGQPLIKFGTAEGKNYFYTSLKLFGIKIL